MRPIEIVGPYPCASPLRRPAAQLTPIKPVPLALMQKHCFWLLFATLPPDPSQRFFVAFPEIVNGDWRIQVPTFQFDEAKRREPFALP